METYLSASPFYILRHVKAFTTHLPFSLVDPLPALLLDLLRTRSFGRLSEHRLDPVQVLRAVDSKVYTRSGGGVDRADDTTIRRINKLYKLGNID